jgi:hypothetical protein
MSMRPTRLFLLPDLNAVITAGTFEMIFEISPESVNQLI